MAGFRILEARFVTAEDFCVNVLDIFLYLMSIRMQVFNAVRRNVTSIDPRSDYVFR